VGPKASTVSGDGEAGAALLRSLEVRRGKGRD
jgi:hypothetical protein